jgi:hypothetical protein
MPDEADKLYIRVRGTRLGARYKIANVLMAVDLDFERQEAIANARLIAKAPELLAQLDLIISEYFDGGVLNSSIEEAQDLLAHVRGESA